MTTECNGRTFVFQTKNSRDISARFDGGPVSSDGGAVLLHQAERHARVISRFAACFNDHRDADLTEHTVEDLVAQRVYGLCLGYEDLNDHDDLRHDPLMAALVGKKDPTGGSRARNRDKGKALAGKSTLNRLELTPVRADKNSRYKKISVDRHAVDAFFTEIFLESDDARRDVLILDLDATDDILHGNQAGRFFHGYYKNYCYLPLYIFCGDHLLCSRLRPSDIDASAGSVKELDRIVKQIRQRRPEVQIIIRADSGFCREEIMLWCEANNVDYVLGLARNNRLKAEISEELVAAKELYDRTGRASRVFKDFAYQTLKSWSRSRRVVGKAEYLSQGENPRFVVTSLSSSAYGMRALYEELYCARGDMENRIKEQQLWLFADRTSAATMRANQLRLWFSSVAYTLMIALKTRGLKGTKLANAQCNTIRLKLLKVGARIKVTVRRIWVSLSQSCPYQHIFERAYDNLAALNSVRLRC